VKGLVDQIVAIEAALRSAQVPHAFGGALALAFHVEEPRATRDIDCNIFAGVAEARTVFAVLPSGVHWTDDDVTRVLDDGQVRLSWDGTPLDLFFSTHPFHEQFAAQHVVDVPFAGITIPVLEAEPLAVFKVFFNRTRDWADVEAMLEVGALDVHLVLGWLVNLLGPDDDRVTRFRALIDRPARGSTPRFDP
jgi:hypothetical protein